MVRYFPGGRTSLDAARTTDNSSADGARSRRDPVRPHRGRTPRQRLAASLAGILVCVFALQAVTASAADDEGDLKRRKNSVTNKLDGAREEFRHSSRRLSRATAALQRAQAELDKARDHLARTRAQLQQAIEFDRRMQRKLDEAKQRLAQAREDLAAGEQQVANQREEVAHVAAENFQDPGKRLMELQVLLNSQSQKQLSTQMEAARSITSRQSNKLDQLRAAEVLLKVNEQEVEEAKEQVAQRRDAAARNLERKKQLKAEAEQAKASVATLVGKRREARQEAQAAKEADERQINELEAERERLQNRLEELARKRRAERQAQQRSSSSSSSSSSAGGGALLYPVSSYITSPYGMRLHPTLGYWKLHDGTDFSTGCGTPVRAADSGSVMSTYYNTGYGNRIIVDHGVERGVSLTTSYNHLSSYAVSPGESVSRGEIIGYAGTTGYSTGCHLHFMVYENGATVDPMTWL